MLKLRFKNKHSIVLILVVVVSELLVGPWGEFPLNDDWSYAKSVKLNLDLGILDIGMWGAMTLATQIYWGVLWSKLFGFSFFVLRLSTLVSSLIGLLVFFKLLERITNQKTLAFAAALSLYFIPIYFNLSNTFMTDVNFSTLCILFLYFGFEFHRSSKLIWFVPLFIVATALIFLRQFGIVAPLALVVSCFFKPNKKTISAVISISFIVVLAVLLHYYENYLREHLPNISAYRFSDGLNFGSAVFYSLLCERLALRLPIVLNTVLLFTLPLTLAALPSTLRMASKFKISVSAIAALSLSVWLVPMVELPQANILNNMSLGPETFYQNWMGAQYHSHNASFPNVLLFFRYLYSVLGLWSLFLLALGNRGDNQTGSSTAWKSLLLFFSVGYFLTLLLSEFFFDRYLLPLFLAALIFYAHFLQRANFHKLIFMISLAPLVYCSIAGTHDYFRSNEQRWAGYQALKKAGAERMKINGGFEVNCWQDGDRVWWSNFAELQHFNYLIQYRPESDFKPVIRLPYRCWFPPKDDNLFIFARNQTALIRDTILP